MEDLTLTVWLVLTPNVLLLDYAGPAEALRMARDMGANLVLHSCAPQPSLATSLGPGLSGLEPLPRTLPPNSLVLVVGNSDEAKDYATPAAQRVVRWLRTAPRADTRLASICSGAILLAQAGWLAGRHCTTHHSLLDALQEAEPTACVESDRVFVDDGRILTSAGITTGIDLALYIVERQAGPELAARVARRLVMYQRRGAQDPQVSPWLAWRNHMHPAVHRAQDAIAGDPARLWTLPALAEQAHVSARHLSRLFAEHAGIGVVAYQQQLRIARARQLLTAAPTLSMERVADQCGFASTRDFRRVWQRFEVGSPADGRKGRVPAGLALAVTELAAGA
jgi:transcriptional regulator GlxA family with amidase domain